MKDVVATTGVVSVLAVSAVSVLLGLSLRGTDGALGAALGIGVGLGLCAVRHLALVGARRWPGRLGLFTALSVLASLLSLVLAMVVIRALAPQFLVTASLTALCVYLVYLGFRSYQESRALCSSRATTEDRGVAAGGALANSSGDAGGGVPAPPVPGEGTR